MKILIVKLSSIGDVVHTLAALASIKRGLPDARVDWLVERPASELLTKHPLLDEVIVVDNGGWFASPLENLKTARRLAARRYDVVVDFQGLLKSALWVWLSKGKRRIGFANSREFSHLFLNEKLPAYDVERHAVDRYLDLAAHMGGAGGRVEFPMAEDAGAGGRGAALLRGCGIEEGEPFFLINPFARWVTKLWPEQRLVEFTGLARQRLRMKAVLVGSAADAEAARRIVSAPGAAKSAGGVANLAGRTGLKELAALLTMARFVLTVDSGPMHMAAAVGTPVVALFGPTAPWRTGPYGKGHTVVTRDLPCSPCFSRSCGDPACMSGIGAEEVLGAVEDLLGSPGTGPGEAARTDEAGAAAGPGDKSCRIP